MTYAVTYLEVESVNDVGSTGQSLVDGMWESICGRDKKMRWRVEDILEKVSNAK